MLHKILAPVIASAALLAGCATTPAAAPDPQDAFMERLSALCGKAFAGRIMGSEPAGADADMAGKPLVMHVRSCAARPHRNPLPCRHRPQPHLGHNPHRHGPAAEA